jgi:hypothetical protein
MGVNTKANINKKYGVADIKLILEKLEGVSDLKIEPTGQVNYTIAYFKYKGKTDIENRNLSIFTKYKDEETKKIVTLLDLNCWGSSIEIIKGILEYVGGTMVDNDCATEPYYVEPIKDYVLTDEEKKYVDFVKKASSFKLNETNKMYEFIMKNKEFIKQIIE